jgi:hypothetical protein
MLLVARVHWWLLVLAAVALPWATRPKFAVAIAFNITTGFNCGGKCNAGKLASDLHYEHMGDESLAGCQAKCDAVGCLCFDFAGPGHNPAVRAGELCRVCPPGTPYFPLQSSTWGYEVYIRQPAGSWGIWLSLFKNTIEKYILVL